MICISFKYIYSFWRVAYCKITNNRAYNGGEIYRLKGLVYTSIVDSEITDNKAGVVGGMYHDGNLKLENVKIRNNRAWKGGGIYI